LKTAVATDLSLLDLPEGAEAALEVLERYLPPDAPEGDVLRARHLDKRFGGVHAVVDVSLDVPSRCLVGLIGPNGAGKTTTFNLINGFETPDTGEVQLLGKDVTRVPPWTRARLGMCRTFQANHIDLDQSVLDNLLAGAHLHIQGGLIGATLRTKSNWTSEARATQAARAVGRLLNLEAHLGDAAGSLDFGAQRRTEIGRSLMSRPRLLLLDEPTAGLDANEALDVIGLVKRLQVDLELAVLLIEHYVEAVFENCDLVYVLVQGAVISVGTPDAVASDAAVRSAYLGD
jgi:branched-chain amino acid transport system ATP-binding protein